MGLDEQICEAIDTIVKERISSAAFNNTLIGIVSKAEDETIGKYKIKYQDGFFYAYAISASFEYQVGDEVYIYVPNNDSTKTKLILGYSNGKSPNTVLNSDDVRIRTDGGVIMGLKEYIISIIKSEQGGT